MRKFFSETWPIWVAIFLAALIVYLTRNACGLCGAGV